MSESDPEPPGQSRRRLIGIYFGIVGLAGALGALVGYAVPAVAGVEETTIAAITFTISPGIGALYGIVGVGTFLLTIVGVLIALSRFDERPIEP